LIKRLPAILVLVAATGTAQGFTGDYILGGSLYGTSDAVFRVDAVTLKLTTLTTGITPSSTSHYVWEVIMAEDNTNFYALSAHYGAAAKIVKLDPAGKVLATVYQGTTALMKNAVNMHMDQNGKLVVFDCAGTANGPSTYFEIDPGTGALSTVATVPRGDSYYGTAIQDIDTGDYLSFVNDMVHRCDRVTHAVTTLVNTGVRIARMSLGQDTLSGICYAGTYNGSASLLELNLTQGTMKTLNTTGLGGTYGLKFDRRVNAGMNRMFVAHGRFSSSPNGISVFDTTGKMTAITSWNGGTGTPMPYSLEVEGTREVQPVLFLAPNDRQILLNFPHHGLKSYVCAIGISGIRPGIPLGDGRLIHLVPDSVAIASLQGAFDSLIPNRVGILDAQGRAVSGLNLNLLGQAVRGLSVFFQVIVLDPKAPAGVAVVAEPYVLKLD
jgi:hypothetical protein